MFTIRLLKNIRRNDVSLGNFEFLNENKVSPSLELKCQVVIVMQATSNLYHTNMKIDIGLQHLTKTTDETQSNLQLKMIGLLCRPTEKSKARLPCAPKSALVSSNY